MTNRYVTADDRTSSEFADWVLNLAYDAFPDTGEDSRKAIVDLIRFLIGVGQ